MAEKLRSGESVQLLEGENQQRQRVLHEVQREDTLTSASSQPDGNSRPFRKGSMIASSVFNLHTAGMQDRIVIAEYTGLSQRQISHAYERLYKSGRLEKERHVGPSLTAESRKVYDLIIQGLSRSEITRETGMRRFKVGEAVRNLIRAGHIDVSDEKRKAEYSETMMDIHDSIWFLIEKYARMRMSPREITEALIVKKKKVPSRERILRSLEKARKRYRTGKKENGLPALTKEEDHDAKLHVHNFRDAKYIRERVKVWLYAYELLREKNLHTQPQTRMDWGVLITILQDERNEQEPAFVENLVSSLPEGARKRLDSSLQVVVEARRDSMKRKRKEREVQSYTLEERIRMLSRIGAPVDDIAEALKCSREIVLGVVSKNVKGELYRTAQRRGGFIIEIDEDEGWFDTEEKSAARAVSRRRIAEEATIYEKDSH